jgi:hypothetical protein
VPIPHRGRRAGRSMLTTKLTKHMEDFIPDLYFHRIIRETENM